MRGVQQVAGCLMSNIIVLDAGPLGLVTYPSKKSKYTDCRQWLEELLIRGTDIRIPEIVDYEVRRGFLRIRETIGVQRLDDLQLLLPYLPITTSDMQRAAALWAQLRQAGLATASDEALDGDVILAAQVMSLTEQGHTVRVATSNKKHIERLVDAELWQNI